MADDGAVIGAVAIGRNEGERLRSCLASLRSQVARIVYVDSGSTDGSLELARQLGVIVVELDRSIPFTAARARNAGFERLMAEAPDTAFVQFVDGDCEVATGWIARAAETLGTDRQAAVVCGRRRERHPGSSIYNQLCDIEWNTPVGDATACGGDALIRVEALRKADGYDPTLIAGEEPDLCLRLRRLGWRVSRVDIEMTLHDAAITRFSQWWRRAVRAGHAYAEGSARHGRGPERHWVRETRSNWFWGLALPAGSLVLAVPTAGLSLGLLLGYGALALRVYRSGLRRGLSARVARPYAFFVVVGKIPMALGQARYWLNRVTGQATRIIEYKGPAAQSAGPQNVGS